MSSPVSSVAEAAESEKEKCSQQIFHKPISLFKFTKDGLPFGDPEERGHLRADVLSL